MSEQRFTLDNSSATFTPREPQRPIFRHNLRFENIEGMGWINSDGHVMRTLSGLTVIKCACGLDTGAVPSDRARLVYEEHRNLIQDEITAGTDG